ncbi:DegT/DnrJ/EryC1/StrS family aminotransferase [Granulosicoccus sp. 3-233]|uniref:DegT/DnrJ/EryC1/StrS family aminotransferase n=1 Tax=Granulosicoccus sp. 3-233 TaxID=3417969 RepID=UPI003D349781
MKQSDEPFLLHWPDSRRRYTYNGSAAIHAALLDRQLERGACVLLPAYCCGAELGPFEQLACEFRFYDIGTDFSISHDEIERILNAQPDIRVMLLTHYLGFAQPEVEAIAALCQARGVTLIEDCAHALFTEQAGRAVGQAGDYAIFSMRKSLPLTEGGALLSKHPLRSESRQPANGLSLLAWVSRLAWSFQQGARASRRVGIRSVARYLSIAGWSIPAVLVKLMRRTGIVPAERWLTPDVEGAAAVPVYGYGISTFSQRLLKTADGKDIRQRRRANHAHWLRLVDQMDGLRPVHRVLPEGACPLYFLVSVANPGEWVKRLAADDIEAFNWWQHLSSRIDWAEFPVARQYKQSLLALPLHQQLDEVDIIRMANSLSARKQ